MIWPFRWRIYIQKPKPLQLERPRLNIEKLVRVAGLHTPVFATSAGVRASAPGGEVKRLAAPRPPAVSSPSGLPDLHTPDRVAWLEVVQSDEARRSMWVIPVLLAVVVCWLALLTWWAA